MSRFPLLSRLSGLALLALLAACTAPPTAIGPAGTAVPGQTLPATAVATLPVPTTEPIALGGPTQGPTYVPILMYHYVRVNPNPRDHAGFVLSVTPTDFAVQMLYLYKYGFHVVSLHEAVEAIATHRALPPHPVVLTFDDGYRDFYSTAAPVLRQLGFTATDYIITGFTSNSRFMDWSMIEALDQEGFTMADHTVNHQALNAMSPAMAQWEMLQAKHDLEAHLGHPVVDLAYPGGDFTASVARQAQQLGFESAVTTEFGPLHTPATLWTMTRMRVSGGISMDYFASLVGGEAPNSSWVSWAKGQAPAMLDQPAPVVIRAGHFI
jgi:peptidoglycan/xylan/chitin deacetylase (PgdA/CDA1 family)